MNGILLDEGEEEDIVVTGEEKEEEDLSLKRKQGGRKLHGYFKVLEMMSL